MNDEQYTEAMYSAFFAELGQLEKQAMLQKVSISVGGIGKGLSQVGKVFTRPISTAKHVGKLFQRGYAGAPKGTPMSQIGSGLKSVWGNKRGRAALLAGGGIALGAPAAVGYLGGRASK